MDAKRLLELAGIKQLSEAVPGSFVDKFKNLADRIKAIQNEFESIKGRTNNKLSGLDLAKRLKIKHQLSDVVGSLNRTIDKIMQENPNDFKQYRAQRPNGGINKLY